METTDVQRRSPDRTLLKVAFRVALILMTLSLLPCHRVGSRAELAEVPFGLPLPFVTLDARQRPPPEYPARVCLGDPRLAPTRLGPLAALADLVLLTAFVIGAVRLVRALRAGGREGRP